MIMALTGKLMQHSAMLSTSLSDKRILVTRAREQCDDVIKMLQSRGAAAVLLPCLQVEALPHAIADGVAMLADFSDVLFTSANGVHAVAAVAAGNGGNLNGLLAGRRIAAVGGRTAAALAKLGVGVDIIAAHASQQGLIAAYENRGLPHALLFFRAEEGSDALADALSRQGVTVATIPAYRTACPQQDAGDVIAMMQRGEIDAVLLGSAKTAAHYLQRMGSTALANRPVIVAISEKMAESARRLGLNVQVVAKVASFEAMLDALAEYFDSGSK